ncbi:YycH family regulatory protein [Cytobacillus purgationiresistens]|uniref:Regulatory protein YycH of two-component signal transduction system YycFG n=1 Tax=Cytobacillus purgationiresistens TaxID=863449 RepID=A0ABU0ALN3_9BACI|nr:two-component system activity regulator YycH [Cytobacillus purgationiresistens]MDQ0271935.1 regulatory protein YycH of two-component signal transduction system YycFG [Cytobacillus purgationiresistens]
MTYENIKTVILVILIASSVLLTWNLWTYQPNFDPIEKPNTVEEEEIGVKKEIQDVIKPKQAINHVGDTYYGTMARTELNRIINEISGWHFDDFEDFTSQVDHVNTFINKEGFSTIIFPDDIPLDLYRNVMTIDDKNIADFTFDKIIVDTNDTNGEDGFVYFVSSANQVIYKSGVKFSLIENYKKNYYTNTESDERYREYISYKVKDQKRLFIPKEKTTIETIGYLSKNLNSEQLKRTLFNDPSVVQKNVQNAMEEFTDSTSIMRVYNDRNLLSYKNLAVGIEKQSAPNPLLKRSIDFINDHGGWTGRYHFFSMDPEKDKVIFRLYDDKYGYPIFSDSEIAKMELVWGPNEINEYDRSNFLLDTPLPDGEPVEPLYSGEDVIELIKRLPEFNNDKLQDVTIAYKMVKEPSSGKGPSVTKLIPNWYYLYNNEWKQLSMEDFIHE